MNDSKKENLRELLAAFMDADSAGRAAKDIEKGDELLRTHPAPQPSNAVLVEVNRKVAEAVRRRQSIGLHHKVWAMAGVAAAIVIASAIGLKLLENRPPEQPIARYAYAIPSRVWEGSDITTDDADIAVLTAEIETIENELAEVSLYENGGNTYTDVGDLETELIEIESYFWKG